MSDPESRLTESLRAHAEAAPDGRMLAEHLEALEVDPSAVLMVGDTIGDAEAAADLGCRCVLIHSGHSTFDALAASGHPMVASLLEAVREVS